MSLRDRLFRRRRLYDDLHDEIQAHLEQKVEALIAAGLSPYEARSAARRAFGNVTTIEERGREQWEWSTAESLLLDLKYAARQLRRTPVLSAIIVFTLAIGIAASATVFSWARELLLDPIPGAGDAQRLMAIETTTSSGSWTPTSWLDYRDFRRYLTSFDGLAAAYPTSLAVGEGVLVERAVGELVSANFFDVLRVRPALGAFFPSSLDESEGAQPTVVISHALWQRRWHSDSAVIGRVITVNHFPFTVVGVAPPSFHGSMPGQQVDVWVPAAMLGQVVPTGRWWLRDRGTRTFRVFARLRDGVSVNAARADVAELAKRMALLNAGPSKGMSGRLMPVWQSHWGLHDHMRAPLLVLLAACGLVLLIVCANAAGLLLARGTARTKELGLRLALGAPRQRLLRQLLTEACVLAGTGAGVGLLGAIWLARSLGILLPSFAVTSVLAPRIDAGVLAFAAVLAVAVTLLAGVAPALHGSRSALVESLNGARGAVGNLSSIRARRVLVIAEMGLAVVSLVGAGLFYESLRASHQISAGFDADHVAMASVSLTLAGYDSARGDRFLDRVADHLRREPGVVAASYTDYVPLSTGSGSWEHLEVEGYAPAPNEDMKLFRAAVGPDYFATLRIPMVEGREFRADDDSAHAAVMIVNQAFVNRFLRGRVALGVRVHGWGRWFTIVGVSKDSKFYRVTDPPTPYFYVPAKQVYRPEYGYTFLMRSSMPVDAAVRTLERDTRDEDPGVPVFNTVALSSYVEGPFQTQKAAMDLLGGLALIATVLAALGLYGVVSYAVAQRTKEIGVRRALGASAGSIVQLVARQGGALLAAGLIVGIPASLMASTVLASVIVIGGLSAPVIIAAVCVMTGIAAASLIPPTQRALSLDPLTALRLD